MSLARPTLLDLRGTFFLPQLSEQSSGYQNGDGHRILDAVPIDQEHMIIHTDASVYLYSQLAPEKIWEIICPSSNFAIDVTHNMLVLTPEDTIIIFWDLCTGQILHQVIYSLDNAEYQVNPNGLEFNRDGSILAVGMECQDKDVVALWNPKDGRLLRVLSLGDYCADITTLAFHPGGHVLAGGSFNHHLVWFWSLDDGRLLNVWDAEVYEEDEEEADRPYDLTFSLDGKWLIAGWGYCGLRVWDVEQEREVARPFSTDELQPSWLDADPSGRFLAVINFGGIGNETLCLLEIGSWRIVSQFAGDLSNPLFSSDGQLLAVSSETGGPARLIDIMTGEEFWQVNG